ncbi:MAG: MFS transporter [Armatimonadota bacterium]
MEARRAANSHDPFYRRNFALGVANGAAMQVSFTCMDPGIVLPAFFVHLMPAGGTSWWETSTFWVGLVSSLMWLGWLWPPAFIVHRIEAQHRKIPVYRLAATWRLLFLAVLVLLSTRAGRAQPTLLASLFAAGVFLWSSGMGVAWIPFFDVVGKAIPANRRGRFFGSRRFVGGILAFCSGLLIRYLLDEERSGLLFPTGYTTVFAMAWLATFAGVLSFIATREPLGPVPRRPMTWGQQLRRGPRILRRDRNYRILVGVRLLSALTNLSFPFMVPFAILRLEAAEPMVGVFVAIAMVSSTTSNVLWSYVSDEQGNRRLLLLTNALGLLSPTAILAAPHFPPQPSWGFMGLSFTPQLLTVCVAVFLVGFARTGQFMGETNFLLDIAPARRRPTYLGLMQTCLIPMAFAPLLGAALIGRPGDRPQHYELAFACSLIFTVLGLVLITQLKEPRERPDSEGRRAAGG